MSIPHWNCETYRDLSYLTVCRVLFCVNKINNFMGLITFPIFTKLEKNSKSVYYSIQLWYIHDPLDMNLMTVQVLLNSQEAWSNIKFLRLMFITECMKHTKSKFLNIRVGRSDGEFFSTDKRLIFQIYCYNRVPPRCCLSDHASPSVTDVIQSLEAVILVKTFDAVGW